jgi:hypothetical protein
MRCPNLTASDGLGALVAESADLMAMKRLGDQQQAQLEHEARYGREVVQRLDALMEAHRDGREVSYADLQAVRGDV